jgi:energy-coupling factor transport system permease protein
MAEVFKGFLFKSEKSKSKLASNQGTLLIFYLLISLAVLFTNKIFVGLALLILSIVLLIVSRTPKKMALLFTGLGIWFGFVLMLIILIAGLYPGKIYFGFNLLGIPIKVTYGNLYVGLGTFIKVLSLVLLAAFFVNLADPRELVDGLNYLKVPYSIRLSLALMLRNFSIFVVDYETIVQAQKSRGLNIYSGNILQKAKKLLGTSIPLIYLSLKRADDVINALEVRGFDPKAPRTTFRDYKLTKQDFTFIILAVLILVITITFNFFKVL